MVGTAGTAYVALYKSIKNEEQLQEIKEQLEVEIQIIKNITLMNVATLEEFKDIIETIKTRVSKAILIFNLFSMINNIRFIISKFPFTTNLTIV